MKNPKIQVFCVFHKAMSEPLSLSIFSREEINRWFTFYAVNQKISTKKYIRLDFSEVNTFKKEPKLIEEYLLPIHNPLLQDRGYMETSCYIHVLENGLFKEYDWIGICQYDMSWSAKSKAVLRKLSNPSFIDQLIDQARSPVVFAQVAAKKCIKGGALHPMASANTFNWDYLLNSYNRFFNVNYAMRDFADAPLTLWQTYLMPQEIFVELASWLRVLVEEIYPWANQPPYETHWGVLGGLTERAESVFMAIRASQGAIRIKKLYLNHDDTISQQLDISKNHYQ